MSDMQPRRRVVVTGRRGKRPGARRVSVDHEIDSQTGLGEAYVRSLVRSQLRLAALVCATVGATLGLLPLLFHVLPWITQWELFGIPLPWLLLGVLVYPLLIGAAAYYVRHAERNERDFSDLVGR